jgi:hypothetical protein
MAALTRLTALLRSCRSWLASTPYAPNKSAMVEYRTADGIYYRTNDGVYYGTGA